MYRKLLLIAFVLLAAQSFAQPLFRLHAFSGYVVPFSPATGTFQLQDTARYFYNGSYGSILPINYLEPELLNKVVDISKTYPSFRFDSAYIMKGSYPMAGPLTSRNIYSLGKLLSSTHYRAANQMIDSYVYNPVDRIAEIRRYVNNNSTGSNLAFTEFYVYHYSGNISSYTKDYSQHNQYDIRWEYHYNTNNQLVQAKYYEGTNVNSSKRKLFIYSNNLVVSEVEEHYSAGTWNVFQTINYTYNLGKIDTIEYLHVNNPYARFNYIYDNAGNVVMSKRAFWKPSINAYQDYTRALWTYNSANLPIYAESQHYDADSNAWYPRADTILNFSDGRLHFYYQLYWPTGIAETAKNTTMNVYPLPAGNFINIDIEWDQPQAFTATIVNMEGRIVKQWTEEKTKNYTKTISLPELSPGNYFIRLEGEHEKAGKQILISR